MKQFKIFAVALAALTMFSCSKENTDTPDTTERVMTVKIANPASTKAIETPGVSTAGTITLENGVIFTLNGEAVVGAYELNVTQAATASGQQISDKVTSSITVFVVANVPATKVTEWTTKATTPTTLAAIKASAFNIGDNNGSHYTTATLCNTGATTTRPTASGADAVLATVELSPVYSRLELPKVVGTGTVTSFTVKGVYVDDFYTRYTVGGGSNGNLNSMGQTPPTAWPAEGTDEGTWASAAKVATAGGANVWAYNLPSGNLPRLIIKLEDVILDGGPLTGTWYLSVKAYTDNLTVFAPGDIYHITDGIVFDQTNLGPTPNPTENDLSVKVTIKQWTIKGVGVTL